MKASIPGTAQAKEALIATQIPQTAQVDRAKATYAPQLPGAPDIKPIEGTQLKYVVNSSVPLIQAAGRRVVRAAEGRVVHRADAAGPVVGGDLGAGRDLFDPAQLADLLRDVREDLRRDADDGDGRLSAGLHGNLRRRRHRRLRHRLHVRAVHRHQRLVRHAGDLRLRRGHRLDALDRVGLRLRHGLGLRRRVGRGCVGLGRRAVLGRVCRRRLGRQRARTAPGVPAHGRRAPATCITSGATPPQ